MFLNQTDTIIKKMNPRPQSSSKTIKDEKRIPIPEAASESPQIQRLVEPVSSRAVNMFMFAFSGGIYLDYLPAMYGCQERSSCLHMCLDATALAYMANEHNRKDLRQMALQSYGIALSQTNLAVQNLNSETKLETATSVLLLALFAVISPQNSSESSRIWSEHVRGALAILNSCKTDMFSSLSAQGILHHVISTVQIDCLNRRVQMPPHLKDLYPLSWLSPGPQAQLWSLIDRLTDLTSSLQKQPVSLSYIESLRNVDSELADLMEVMPEAYSNCFEFEKCTTSATILPNGEQIEEIPLLKFNNWRMAQRWNTLRMLRLRSTDLLISATTAYLLSVEEGSNLREVLQRSLGSISKTAKQITIEICATVPENLRPDQIPHFDNTGIEESAWARSLAWPLSMAKATSHNSEILQDYIDRQIRVLGKISGMRHLDLESISPSDSSAFKG